VVFTPDDTINYGPAETQVPVTVNYVTDFENATKGSYASDDLTLDGVNWNMNNVLVGALANDFKIGTKSARLQGNVLAAMTMMADLPGGIGTLSFQHRRYDEDNQVEWIVERSMDQAITWSEVGRFTAGADASAFTAVLDIAGPARLRIRNAVTASRDGRANLDEIVITPYIAPVLPRPVITSPLLGTARVGADFTYQLTALNNPDLLEIEDLPAGLVADPQTPGHITGRPSEDGSFSVALRAANGSGETTATLQLDIARSSYAEWSGQNAGSLPSSPVLLAAYAIGGAAGPQSRGETPVVAIEAGSLVVSAVIRTDDPSLVVAGMAVGDLSDFGGPGQAIVAGQRAADQSGVPIGHEHQLFRVPVGSGESRKFFRLEVSLRP
jgi:hypothetical protein